jgi:hypothetical protein
MPYFRPMPGQRHDSVDASTFDGLVADKPVPNPSRAFNSNALVAELNERGIKVACRSIGPRAEAQVDTHYASAQRWCHRELRKTSKIW